MASEPRVEAGIGHYLAAQRRLRGVSLDELAELTKIPPRSLERLESGAFDSASDGFVRGFVRTVAEALGLDPDEAVMRMLEEPRADGEAHGPRTGHLDRRGLLAPLVLLAGVALLVLLCWKLVAFWMAPSSDAGSRGVLVRRDPVRELAAEVRPASPAASREAPAMPPIPLEAPDAPAPGAGSGAPTPPVAVPTAPE